MDRAGEVSFGLSGGPEQVAVKIDMAPARHHLNAFVDGVASPVDRERPAGRRPGDLHAKRLSHSNFTEDRKSLKVSDPPDGE